MPRRGSRGGSVETRISFPYPISAPAVPRSNDSIVTIQRVEACLRGFAGADAPTGTDIATPLAVAIGPYHHDERGLEAMEAAKRAALEEFCRAADQPLKAVEAKIFPVALSCLRYYADDYTLVGDSYGGGGDIGLQVVDPASMDGDVETIMGGVMDGGCPVEDDKFARMMLLDGCFLLQFMVSMCPDDPETPPWKDPLMSRVEVHTCIDAIARDVMLLENQIPWPVLQALMELRPGVPVDRFLALMASAFDAGNDADDQASSPHSQLLPAVAKPNHGDYPPPPPHLLGLFYRRQVGPARTQSLRVPRLSSLTSTAVELAEMGVKLAVSKTKKFGDMAMVKRRRRCGLSGELSVAPVALNDVTACWLVNMAAYEACLGAALPDNFAVSSYISVVALLANREEDVRELRAKGIVSSTLSDMDTLQFFKWAVPYLRVGHRYYEVFQGIHEYRNERRVWIAVHRFFYNNSKTIVAVLSIIGVLAGLFKTILSLKQPQQ